MSEITSENKYTAEYFEGLGFEPDAAEKLAHNWKPKPAQTMEEVREGIKQEREARDISADATWAKDLGTKK